MREKELRTYEKNKNESNRIRELKWLHMSKIPKNFMEFIQLDFNHKSILLNRMSGMTLQEVGQIEGVTRERVRQIESKLLKILPEFDDVKAIKKIILDYDIKENEFVEYFHEPKEIYQFVILKSKKNVCNRPFEEYLLNVNKTNPQLIKETLKKKKKFINYNGEIVDLDINNVINQVLFNDQNIYTISKLQDAIKFF